ncbi:MAG TPA: hypothetical protein VNT54_17765 [Solirubrobacteraceae bacterium]|nr:hypothetical protein [Solirubrobacteraceae bacterium]
MASDRHERIARNESAFRDLNERLEANVHRGETEPDYAGFVCECGDRDCDTTVRMALGMYEQIRQDSMLFFVVAGHEAPDAEDVLDEAGGYLVVRKHEDVAKITERTDPRR